MLHRWSLAFVVLLYASAILSAQGPSRLPPPAEAELAAAKKLVAEVYQSDYAAAKTPLAQQALATKLLQDGLKTNDDPVARFALLQIARKIAAQAGDVDLAYQAADATVTGFRVSGALLKAEALMDAAESLRASQEYFFFGRYADRLVPELCRVAAWDEALALANMAGDVAKKMRDADLATYWTGRQAELTQLKRSYQAALPAVADLEKSPGDAALNQTVGQLNCFVLDAWPTGLPMLALGMDPALQQAAETELRRPTATAEKVALADAWYELAKTHEGPDQRAIFRHAYRLYGEAIPTMAGLTKAKAQTRASDCYTRGMPDRIALASLKPALMERVYRENNEPYVKTVALAGRRYPDSLWAHPPNNGESRFVFELPGDFKYLAGMCGIRDMPGGGPASPVQFRILGSNGELWRAPAPLKQLNKSIPFKVDLKGEKRIELVVHCKGANYAVHACWIHPMLQK